MRNSEICDRSFHFARRAATLCERLAPRGFVARRMAGQLFDAASSIGANAEEARAAQSKADFIAKLSLCRKEACESRYWLRLIVSTGFANSEELAWELQEANELVAMTTSAVRTAQASHRRGDHPSALSS